MDTETKYCTRCDALLTEADFEAEECTQCSFPLSKKRERQSYMQMRQRCLNPNNNRYARYGGRGIRICDRWLESFDNFYADMGPRPQGTSIERRDNDGDYEPNNCRWATPKEQSNNMSRNRYLEHKGKRQTLAQWCRELGLDKGTIRARLRRGWTMNEAFNLNVEKKRKREGLASLKRSVVVCAVPECGRTSTLNYCKRHRQAIGRGNRLLT